MTNYTWTDNAMRSGSTCDVDKVADNLMHLKYNAGGLLPVNDLGTKTSNFTLDVNKINLADITSSLTISLPTTGFISGVENKCILDFATTSASTPTLPSGLKWSKNNNGVAPTTYSTLSGVRNILIFTTRDGGTTWEVEYLTYGAVETTFSQPTLSANGTLGGSSFAVAASSVYAGREPYLMFDNNSSTHWTSNQVTTGYVIFYNPNALKVSSIAVTNRSDSGVTTPASFAVYGSNDNSTYTLVGSYTNSNSTNGTTWIQAINSTNFYNYHKIQINSVISGVQIDIAQINVSAVYIGT